jgi:predicted molibdopterin-dependent oxidoreductase YjgC
VTGLATTFGSGAMTNSINEIEHAQVILVSGSNTSKTHPQVARRILNAVDNGAKLIVVDPRRTPMAERAHLHLALRPGSDIPLINAMMRIIFDENLIDDAKTISASAKNSTNLISMNSAPSPVCRWRRYGPRPSFTPEPARGLSATVSG